MQVSVERLAKRKSCMFLSIVGNKMGKSYILKRDEAEHKRGLQKLTMDAQSTDDIVSIDCHTSPTLCLQRRSLKDDRHGKS